MVWDIVEFCRENDIYCQGRGSAANSAVCYALGVTKADAVSLGLLFERFLSPERDGPPDIDLDIESGRREEAIQHVYEAHGRHHTAQVANVITYRARSAVRDMAKALGFAAGQQDAWSKQVDAWGRVEVTEAQRGPGSSTAAGPPDHDIPADVLALAKEVEDYPRHLGIHSGGMVICDRPVIEVCPVEWARMENRSVLQWDKDDCAAVGLVKFDLLGLGMLSALHHAVDLIRDHRGYEVDLATIPQEPEVYDMLCRADSVGVFQVESRAQMATLPRLRPRTFYDLVVEVALIRPGPIQGGSVHPYIRRRNGQEEVTYLHPLLEPSLKKTLGVPLFQEQLMQMAIDVAGFTPAEADELRQAMGSKRSRVRMERLRARVYAGMAERGIEGEVADEIFLKMSAFANYGFPESHSVSFAYLVYASSWIKLHEPAAFCAALLNAQPMGFYSPHSLVQDARRHGVVVRTPDLNRSAATAVLEPCSESHHEVAVRMGLRAIRGLGAPTKSTKGLADLVTARRAEGGPYRDLEDLVRRVPELRLPQLEAMATAGAFGCFGLERREALWAVGALSQSRPDRLEGVVTGARSPTLPGMTPVEESVADLWATGVSPEGHPTRFLRERLASLGVVTATGLWDVTPGQRVLVGGIVTHRQRPMTAQGTTFMNLEDETGLINVVCSKGCWARYRRVARDAPALLVQGRLERSEGVINVVAERLDPLPVAASVGKSRLSVTFVAIVAISTTKVTQLKQETLVTRPTTPTEQPTARRGGRHCGGARRWCRSQVQSWPWQWGRPASRPRRQATPHLVVEGPVYSFDTVVARGTGCDPAQPAGVRIVLQQPGSPTSVELRAMGSAQAAVQPDGSVNATFQTPLLVAGGYVATLFCTASITNVATALVSVAAGNAPHATASVTSPVRSGGSAVLTAQRVRPLGQRRGAGLGPGRRPGVQLQLLRRRPGRTAPSSRASRCRGDPARAPTPCR